MAAAAITACSGKGCQDHCSGRGGSTGRHHSRDDGWGDRGTQALLPDSETAAESQSSESASQGGRLPGEEAGRDVSHAGGRAGTE